MAVDYLRIVLALAASLAVGVGVIWLLSKRGVGVGRLAQGRSAGIEVLEVRQLGGRNALVALRWRDQEALVVLGPGHAHTVLQKSAAAAEKSA